MSSSSPRVRLASWALYDAANSAFPLVITTAVFVLYFKGVVVGGEEPGFGDFLWGLSISLSAALVALTSPIVGSVADLWGARKRVLMIYTLVAVIATLGLSFAGPGMWLYAMICFIIANAAFEGGMVFYGALLPSIVEREKMGRASGIGWATGYVGGLICLIACLGLATSGQVPTVVRIVALWFLLLSIPIFVNVPEPPSDPNAARRPFKELGATLREIWQAPGLRRFFLAYFLYNDAIITVFSFSAPFATDELGYTMTGVILLVAGVQVTGAIGAFAFGLIADKLGHGRTIVVTLCIWLGVTLGAFLTARDLPVWQADVERAYEETRAELQVDIDTAESPLHGASAVVALARFESEHRVAPQPSRLRQNIFGVLGLIVGFAMGATQAASRAFLATVAPARMSGRLFGLYAVAGRFSAIIGPLLFGTLSLLTGSKAWSVLALGALFAGGLFLIRGLDEKEVARELSAEDTP